VFRHSPGPRRKRELVRIHRQFQTNQLLLLLLTASRRHHHQSRKDYAHLLRIGIGIV